MVYKYHVTLSEDKKDVFSVEKREDLPKKVFNCFGLDEETTFKLQLWDNDFEDWCNVQLKDLPEKAKIKFLLGDPEVMSVTSVSAAEKSTKATSSSSHTTQSLMMIRPWPVPFDLPYMYFPRDVREALHNKVPLSKGLQVKLTDSLYEEITRYGFFPTSQNYTEVARVLLTTYPYLGDGLVGSDAQDLWIKILRRKCQNGRGRKDQHIQIVKARKVGKRNQDDPAPAVVTTCKKQKKCHYYGLPNFLPDRPVEEDDLSIENHINWMKLEDTKKKQNQPKITLLMEKTFADRRKIITLKGPTIKQIKEEFPCLFSVDEIQNEFQRLSGVEIMKSLIEGTSKYFDAIYGSSKSTDHKANIMLSLAMLKDPLNKQAIKLEGALLLVPQLLSEKLDMLILIGKKEAAETSRHPILVNEEPDRSILDPDSGAIIKLYAEGDLICESRCFMDALASLIAAYYVFNIHYPTGLTCTLTFMQKIVLNLQDKEKTPQRVIKALKKLNTWNKENLKQ